MTHNIEHEPKQFPPNLVNEVPRDPLREIWLGRWKALPALQKFGTVLTLGSIGAFSFWCFSVMFRENWIGASIAVAVVYGILGVFFFLLKRDIR